MLSFVKEAGIIEISLVQIIFYSALWLVDDYFALLVSVILTVILFAVLVISIISELLERSKVPMSYFKMLGISILIPIVVGAFFYLAVGITTFRPM